MPRSSRWVGYPSEMSRRDPPALRAPGLLLLPESPCDAAPYGPSDLARPDEAGRPLEWARRIEDALDEAGEGVRVKAEGSKAAMGASEPWLRVVEAAA